MSNRIFRSRIVSRALPNIFLQTIFCLLAISISTKAAVLPPNFEDTLVANIPSPTALVFAPDGRLLVTTQTGQVRVYQSGGLLTSPAIDLNSRLCTNSERGLLGIAVDPSFSVNHFVYLYYTFNKFNTCPTGQPTNPSNPVNRVARFTLADNNAIDPASETILIDNIVSPNGNHNGGDLHFGKDGLLYVSVGDGGADYAGNSGSGGANDASRDINVLLGKILRITPGGAIPAGNPYQGSNSGRCSVTGSTTPGNWCQETFANGLRNPFRTAFDPNAAGTRFFINDVGQNVWEEIDEGTIGADYGWNIREGHCANDSTTNCGAPPAGLTNPIFDYQHTGDCSAAGVRGNSITAGAFIPNGLWAREYDNSYLFGEYVCGKIFKLTPNSSGGGYTATEFATGLGGDTPVAMIFGPDGASQALYYTAYSAGGAVRRIRFTGTANRSPVASATASPSAGAAPLNVAFNASASTDPDGDPLTFTWNFGDGTTGSGVGPTHRYAATGTYTASVTANDGRGGTNSFSLRIDVGNTAPVPTIISPTSSQLFRVGETITLQGSATDVQDGNLPASRLTWEVILHHDTHTHPFLPPTAGNNITFTTNPPEDLLAATNSYLEIKLTATDSNGLSTTISQIFNPRKVNITLATVPAGLNLTVNGTTVTGSTTFVSWDAYALNVNAPNQNGLMFQSWSDGGAQAHTIITPATAANYTATFQTTGGGTLPGGWTSQDIGGVGLAGSAGYSGGTWTVKGSGGDIWDNADAFRYVYQPLNGDGQIVARVTSVSNTDAWAKAGVMIRQSLTTNSAHAMVVVTPGNGVAFQRRTSAGAVSDHTAGARVTAPYWVRLVRSGSIFTAYSSPDGATWTQIGTATISMTATVYIGLTVTAHNNSALNTSTFTNVSVTSGGLVGEYFDNRDLTGLVTTRRDATINFDWGTGTPAGTALTSPDTFSVRWTGRVLAPATGSYTFTTTSDDGVRLWVNNQLIIDNWTDHSATNNSGVINLTAGNYYDIKMEFYENGGLAVAKLFWSYPGQAQQIVPNANLSANVLFVVGNAATLSKGDATAKERLENLGYTVTVKEATAAATVDSNDKSLVIVSSTSLSADVGTKFRNIGVPVVTWEQALFDDLGMTGSATVDHGTIANQTQLSILDTSHQLAAALSGVQTVTTAPVTFTWGVPNANAVSIAAVPGENKIVIFGYDKDAPMLGLNAPARRVGLYLEDTSAANLNQNGKALFDAAIRWAAGR